MKAKLFDKVKRSLTMFLAVMMMLSIVPTTAFTAYADPAAAPEAGTTAYGPNMGGDGRYQAGIYTSSVTGAVYPSFCVSYGSQMSTAVVPTPGPGGISEQVYKIAAAATQMGAASNIAVYTAAQGEIWKITGGEKTFNPNGEKWTAIKAKTPGYDALVAQILALAATIQINPESMWFCVASGKQNRIVYIGITTEKNPPLIHFPIFNIEAQKYDSEGGFDNNNSTGRGDAVLDATIDFSGSNDAGTWNGSESQVMDANGSLGSWTFKPWTSETDCQMTEGDDGSSVYEASATITIKETPPVGYKGEPTSDYNNIITNNDTPAGTGTSERTYTLTYKATVVGTTVKYEIACDGAAFDVPDDMPEDYMLKCNDVGKRAEFHNQVKKANLQLVKTKADDLDPFTPIDGSWNSGLHPMVNSYWSMKLISGGSESNPYVHAVKITNNGSGYNVYVQDATYVITNDGSGTVMDGSDAAHSFVTNEYGQLYIYNIPYGKYEMKETQAENPGYVLETVYIDVQEQTAGATGEGKIITSSTTTMGNGMYTVLVTDAVKKNEIQVVKKDSETGKTIPMANTTFRIRYMGRDGLNVDNDGYSYSDANIGRLLLNGTSITGTAGSTITSDKYLFLTDYNGKFTIPYELEYGNYQLEEICAPSGYYVGTYDETGVGSTVDGSKGYYDTVVIYDANGNKVDFYQRDAEGNILYDDNGNPISKTDTDDASKLIFNVYPFSVTQDTKDVLTIQAVNMTDNAVKGKVEITKTGETLVGFKQTTDEAGHTTYVPVYEQKALPGATFEIYSAEDVVLNDAIDPPEAFKRADDSQIVPELVEWNHSEFPNAVRVETKTLEDGTKLEYIMEADQETLANQDDVLNVSYATLSTATQKGTSYVLEYAGVDENGNDVSYKFEFAMEYAAGGWSFSDVHITKNTKFATYGSEKDVSMPEFLNGTTPIALATAVYENGNRSELLSDVVNEGIVDETKYELYQPTYDDSKAVIPEMAETTYNNEPLYKDGYVRSDFDMSVYIQTDGTDKANDEIAIANADGTFKKWMLYTDYLSDVAAMKTAGTPELAPVAMEAEFTPGYNFVNKIALPGEDWYYTHETEYYVISNGTESRVAIADDGNGLAGWVTAADVSDVSAHNKVVPIVDSANNTPAIPDGGTAIIIHPTYFESTVDGKAVVYTDNGWMDKDEYFSFGTPKVPDGYKLEDFGEHFTAVNEAGEYIAYIIDHTDGDTLKWLPSDKDGNVFASWKQEYNVSLVQHNESTDGWTVNFDGFVFTNTAKNEEMAEATFTNPFEGVVPVVTDGVGCEVATDGNKTTVKIPHPTDTAYFKMQDDIQVSVIYLGGYTKTIIRVPDGATFPKITDKNGNVLDLLNEKTENPVGPDYRVHEIVGDNGEYVRTTYVETTDKDENAHLNIKSYHIIEVVSSATKASDSYTVDYYDGHTSKALVMTNTETGVPYGKLFVYAESKTMRYPLGKLVETIVSDENGIATSSELPLGSYYIREKSAPDGFVTSTGTYDFTLSYEGQYIPLVWKSASIENAAMDVQLDLYKTFQNQAGGTEFTPKAGAVFGVYAYSDIKATATATETQTGVTQTIPAGTLMYTVTTDAAGRVLETIRLPKGDYYVQEISTLPGYVVDTHQYIFRVDETSTTGALKFDYELNGIFGQIVQTGKGTAQAVISTRYQVPMVSMTVNGTKYDVLENALTGQQTSANGDTGFSIESGFLGKNVIDADRSTFTIDAAKGNPVTVEFANGAKLVLTVDDETYTAVFTDGTVDGENSAVNIDTGTSTNLTTETNDDGSKTVTYSPVVAYTGYTVSTDTTYNKPDTKLVLANGATAAWTYDNVAGAKGAVINYPDVYVVDSTVATKTVNTAEPLSCKADDEAAAKAIATLAGNITFVKFADGNATFIPTDANVDLDNLKAVIETAKANGVVGLDINYVVTTNTAVDESKVIYFNGSKTVPAGVTVNADAHTVTVDPKAFGDAALTVQFGKNGESVELAVNGKDFVMTSAKATAMNSTSNATVADGYQADTLRVATVDGVGKTLTMGNRTITLESANAQTSVDIELAYGQEYANVTINGTVISSWVDGKPTTELMTSPFVLNKGKAVTLLLSDGATYTMEINDKGILSADVKAITNGGFTYGNGSPMVKLNGSADNLLDANNTIIVQSFPLTATTKDQIAIDLSKSVTYARNDSSVSQIEVKVNSRDDNMAVSPIKNYKGPEETTPPTTPPSTPPGTPDTMYVSKVDVTDGKPIPGATLVVKNSAGNIVANGPTDANGNLSFEKPAPGKYYLTETIAPAGYGLNTQTYCFTVNADGTITGATQVPDNVGPGDDKVFIRKEDTTTADGVPGAEIEVTNKETGEVIFTGTTNSSGYIGFEKPAQGTYEFHETVAPNGYFMNETIYTFTVNADGSIHGDNTVTDVPNTVTITKTDYSTGKALKGATIEVYDDAGVLIKVGVTDENGKLYVAIPDYGTYHYRESVAPEGYILDEGTYTITIGHDGTITGQLKFTNEAIVPQTGIEDWLPIALAVLGIASLAYVGITLMGKKKRYSL